MTEYEKYTGADGLIHLRIVYPEVKQFKPKDARATGMSIKKLKRFDESANRLASHMTQVPKNTHISWGCGTVYSTRAHSNIKTAFSPAVSKHEEAKTIPNHDCGIRNLEHGTFSIN